jgi:hypothetical protein
VQVLSREAQVVPPLGGSARIGRIGKVVEVGDAGLLLFRCDFPVKVSRHAVELGDHHLDLRHAAALLVDLKALEADERVPRLHLDSTPHVAVSFRLTDRSVIRQTCDTIAHGG